MVRNKCSDLIAKYPGCLTLITTGGDTIRRTDSKIAKWAMANKMEVMVDMRGMPGLRRQPWETKMDVELEKKVKEGEMEKHKA